MEAGFIISIGVNILLLIAFFSTVRAHAESILEKNLLESKLLEIQAKAQIATSLMRDIKKEINTQKTTFDKTTTDLIKLASNNTNENEARTAALQACKRISKQWK